MLQLRDFQSLSYYTRRTHDDGHDLDPQRSVTDCGHPKDLFGFSYIPVSEGPAVTASVLDYL